MTATRVARAAPAAKRAAKMGRPTTYNRKLAERICVRVAAGELFTHVLKDIDVPVGTMYRWLNKQPEFRELYAQAREIQADVHADELVAIADDATPELANVARLRVDARKWVASKLRPKTWGDKQQVEMTVETVEMELIDFTGYNEIEAD